MDDKKVSGKTRKPRVIKPEVRAKQIDKKIEKLKTQIAGLEAEKAELLKPIKAKAAVEEALKNMKPEEIAEKLGISLD